MRFSEEKFLACVDGINEKNYDYGNDVLYRNCGFDCLPVPGESPIDTKFSSAIWLIGKAYSADPTRSAPGGVFSNNGLGSSFEEIATHVWLSSTYGDFYWELKRLCEVRYDYDYKKDQENLLSTVLLVAKFNGMIKEAMEDIAKEKGKEDLQSDNVVSFCSKFLHFMCPHLFFIVDSFSISGGAALFARSKGRTLVTSSGCIGIDDAAKDFFKNLPKPPPSSDSDVKEPIASYYTHCLRAYRLACFLQEKGKKCAEQIKDDPNSCYMPRLVDSVLMRITKDTEK